MRSTVQDLDLQVETLLLGRMRAERERQAKQYRSEGEEASTRIRSDADRQKALILAEAARDAQIVRGEGDARAAAIFADAYGKSPEFYSYQRWLETLRRGLEKNSSLILSNGDPLLNLQR